MSQYEIEIKSLLGHKKNADLLKKKMKDTSFSTKLLSQHKQLNHYFIDGDTDALYVRIAQHVDSSKRPNLKKIFIKGKKHSIRTRQMNDKVFFVAKASIDDTTSENGISRMEFEEETVDLTLEQLDRILLDSGFIYQAKWSREREEYKYGGINICLDKNAGYGYVAEFEIVVNNENDANGAEKELRSIMKDLDVEELPQDKLERMFAHYNKNWPEYYGTEKVFVIE